MGTRMEGAMMMGTQMGFARALVLLKDGGRVARSGWGSSMWSMWLVLVRDRYGGPGFSYEVTCNHQTLAADDLPLRPLPWIGMKTADNGLVPWACSSADLLAEDWEQVGETYAEVLERSGRDHAAALGRDRAEPAPAAAVGETAARPGASLQEPAPDILSMRDAEYGDGVAAKIERQVAGGDPKLARYAAGYARAVRPLLLRLAESERSRLALAERLLTAERKGGAR